MSEATHESVNVAPAAPAIDEDAALALLGVPTQPKAAAASVAEAKPAAGKGGETASVDPLDPSLFTEDKLKTPEDFQKATKRLLDELSKVNDLKRKTFRAHGAAEVRERKVKEREGSLDQRETRVTAIERIQTQAVEDFESGDTTRFLTAVGKLSKTGDPVGFWRNAAIALAKGEAFKPEEKAAIAADPELKQRLEGLEKVIEERQAREETAQIEQIKTQNYELAKGATETHPHLAAFCVEHPERAREGIAAVMLEEFQRIGRPVDISTAAAIIERELSARYELSQRADGKTNGEKETTSPGLDAGRETSKEPPKPAMQTVPAALTAAPASAQRAETADEERARQIRELDALGIFG